MFLVIDSNETPERIAMKNEMHRWRKRLMRIVHHGRDINGYRYPWPVTEMAMTMVNFAWQETWAMGQNNAANIPIIWDESY